jgi:alkylation response protein AidB-like acyl-CoA dehydrogenase
LSRKFLGPWRHTFLTLKNCTKQAPPISSFQAIQFKLADMAMEIELARLMYYKAAWLYMQNKPFTQAASMAKLFASW